MKTPYTHLMHFHRNSKIGRCNSKNSRGAMGIFKKEIREVTWRETINRLKYHRVCIEIDDLLDELKFQTKK